MAAPAAMLLTASAVGLGVLTSETPSGQDLLADKARNVPLTQSITQAQAAEARDVPVSRSQQRTAKADPFARTSQETKAAVRKAKQKLWTTADLNLWDAPDDKATQVGLVDAIEKVLVTGRRSNERAEIVQEGKTFWVTAAYLSEEKPDPGPNLGGACTNGTSVPSGVDPSITKVHAAVCANWPEVTTYGTFRSDGEHGQGRAVDIMISGGTGWEIADFLRENYAALGIEYIIYSQKIWSVERSGEGWRGMSDRGSVTANHYDHVHVTVY
ncbi:MAG: SH3 domain-containing protein [Nocardioides sp.]|uniref:SH3 domain-containing protein n=1 Tax=Nocardioides sp. TaxID=35761 RepID=UPI003F043538